MPSNDTVSPIVITGGAQRLGLVVARSLRAQQHAVVITYGRERPLPAQLRRDGIETTRANFDDERLTGKTIALDGGRHLARAS
jgi:dihydromonapterin reductase/dihydrofolate reductase